MQPEEIALELIRLDMAKPNSKTAIELYEEYLNRVKNAEKDEE